MSTQIISIAFSNSKEGLVSAPVTVEVPSYGYETEIHMLIRSQKLPNGKYVFNDMHYDNDYRIAKISTWQMSADSKKKLNKLFRETGTGRGAIFYMSLGGTSTGFYPFGPDYGDFGIFPVYVLSRTQGGVLRGPFGWFSDDIQLVLAGSVTYSPGVSAFQPTVGVAEGLFAIGDVCNLRHPEECFQPEATYSFCNTQTQSGMVYTIDGRDSSDMWTSSFDVVCNAGNAGVLVKYLTQSRTADIILYAGDNEYPFGVDIQPDGEFETTFLGSTDDSSSEILLTVKHQSFDRFSIPLKFWMKEFIRPNYDFEWPLYSTGSGEMTFMPIFKVNGNYEAGNFEYQVNTPLQFSGE